MNRETRKLMFSSLSDEWETPQDVFDDLNAEFGFEIDVCATAENAKCARYFDKDIDGLSREWHGICYMNPPYGRQIGKWIKKAEEESRRPDTVVVGLLPARTDTSYFHQYILGRAEIRFLMGRLKFQNRLLPGWNKEGKFKISPAPFPSMIVIWNNRPVKESNLTRYKLYQGSMRKDVDGKYVLYDDVFNLFNGKII